MEIFLKLGWFFKKKRKSYLIGVLFLGLVALLQLIPPWIIGRVVDEIAQGLLTPQSLTFWLGTLFAVAILQYLFRYIWRVQIWGNAAKLEQVMRDRLHVHFTKMDSEFFQNHRTGDLMAHATNDLLSLRMVAGGGILMVADTISIGLTTLIAMVIVVDWRLTVLAVLPLPLLAVASQVLGKKLHHHFRDAQAAFSNMNDKVQESLQGMKVLKTFGKEKSDIEDFGVKTDEIVERNRNVYRVDSLFDPAITLIMGISYFLTILVGGLLVSTNQITIGDLITFINYIALLIWPMFAVGRLFNIIERGLASYERIENILGYKSSIHEKPNALSQPLQGDLSYQVEEFSYPNSERPALKDVYFELKKGNTLGIVGKTGAGKTTILKLLLREYDRYAGSIEYGGIDIRDYTLDSLLKGIGYVPQDNYLFSTTIRDNIRFSNPELSQEEVEKAAKLANIHEDILEFPHGYDTEVGERGVSLSGGQKQRISIARALITRPELMILDDSLSAVDAKTEERILSALKSMKDKQTTIIIAHRISSVMHADEIIVVEDGRIVERGPHHKLLENDGWYKEMYSKQQLERELEGRSI